MKKEIMKDPFFLSQKAIPANPITDKQVIIDLQDTLRANRDRCVGLAANMIGSPKAIIIVAAGPFDIVMVNPVITKKQEAYPAVVQIFEYLKEEFEFIHAVATSRFTYTNQLVRKFLIELMEKMDSIKQNLKQELPMPEDYAREVFIYSNSAIIFHWILKGGVESPEEITKIFLGMCQE